MPTVEFVGQSNRDGDNTQADASRLLNCYRERVNGRSAYVVKSCLGQVAATTIDGVFLRAMEEINGTLYAVLGGYLYRIPPSGMGVQLGAVADSATTTISGNNGNITVAAGGNYYVWDGSTLTSPTGQAFSSFGSVEFYGQFTVLTELNGRRVQWSAVADPETFDGADFATAEINDQSITRGAPVGAEFWIFKPKSIERWAQSGENLAYIPGTAMEPGLKSFGLLTKIQNGVFYVGSDNKVRIATGGGQNTVSTRAVETAIAQDGPQRTYFYRDEGHQMCGITFADRPDWVFDLTEQEWHEREWEAVATTEAYGSTYTGTDTGVFTTLARTNEDNGTALIRRMVSRTLIMDGRRFRVPKAKFMGKVGRNEISAGVPAKVMLRVSKDNGESWSQPYERSLGLLGKYETEIVYRKLGQFKQLTVELSCADPVDAPIDAQCFVDVA